MITPGTEKLSGGKASSDGKDTMGKSMVDATNVGTNHAFEDCPVDVSPCTCDALENMMSLSSRGKCSGNPSSNPKKEEETL